jgi:hypothetical protein
MPGWTIDHLYRGQTDDDARPSDAVIARLVQELYDCWFNDAHVSTYELNRHLFVKLRIGERNPTWNTVKKMLDVEFDRVKRLNQFMLQSDVDDNTAKGLMSKLWGLKQVILKYLQCNALLCVAMSGERLHVVMPDTGNEADATPSFVDADASKLRAFQQTFLSLRNVLVTKNFSRAADAYFCRRMTNRSKMYTQAYEEITKIKDFVMEHTRYDDNFDVWATATSDGSVFPRMVEYLTEYPIAETPDLNENAHLRSYNGDEYGRGAVIYDSAVDMAWPYACKGLWHHMSLRVNEVRDSFDKVPGTYNTKRKHLVAPPDASDVCIVHLDCVFPYDTFGEAMEMASLPGRQCLWHEVEAFECQQPKLRLPNDGDVAFRLHCDLGFDDELEVWGRTWQPLTVALEAQKRAQLVPLDADVLFVRAVTTFGAPPMPHDTIRRYVRGPIHATSCLTDATGRTWVPLHTSACRPRVSLSEDAWHALRGSAPARPDGSYWYTVGPDRPTDGRELQVPLLSDQLRKGLKLDDTRAVPSDLRRDDFVACDGLYARPVTLPHVPRGTWVQHDVVPGTVWHVLDEAGSDFVPYDNEALRAELQTNMDGATGCTHVRRPPSEVHPNHYVRLHSGVCVGPRRDRADGAVWRRVSQPPRAGVRVTHVSVVQALEQRLLERPPGNDGTLLEGVEYKAKELQLFSNHFVVTSDGVYVPLRFARYMRYFRVHNGRTWRDCRTQEFEVIFDCQNLTTYDKFTAYAFQGRCLFVVMEFDTFQLTFIIVGHGGCGKSTIMMVNQRFYPPHARGILSANIESKFGMSEVMKRGRARCIYCNEVSQDLQLVQEEWQTSTSGEEGSYAVKNKAPDVRVCIAQHLWVGNGLPGGKRWKNDMRQVSRRLMGFLMRNAISPRNGNIMADINASMGALNRRLVLAYFDFVEQFLSVDPISVLDRIPPAFATFYNESLSRTDSVSQFFTEGTGTYVEFDDTYTMEMAVLREKYQQFRQARDERRGVWCMEMYGSAFKEHELTLYRGTVNTDMGPRTNVDVIKGIRAIGDDNLDVVDGTLRPV